VHLEVSLVVVIYWQDLSGQQQTQEKPKLFKNTTYLQSVHL
jgi:hypothetical protein